MKTVIKKFDCDNRCQQYVIWIFFMEIELYLMKLENRKKENRITWVCIIQCTTKSVTVTSLLNVYKTDAEKIVAKIQRVFKGRCLEVAIKSCSVAM